MFRCSARTWTDLEDIGALVGDQEDIELLEWLVNESDIRGLNRGMLRVGRDELWEGSE